MKTIGKYYDCSFRMEATETSTTCSAGVMTTCRQAAVGMDLAHWMITLINVVVSKQTSHIAMTKSARLPISAHICIKSFVSSNKGVCERESFNIWTQDKVE